MGDILLNVLNLFQFASLHIIVLAGLLIEVLPLLLTEDNISVLLNTCSHDVK